MPVKLCLEIFWLDKTVNYIVSFMFGTYDFIFEWESFWKTCVRFRYFSFFFALFLENHGNLTFWECFRSFEGKKARRGVQRSKECKEFLSFSGKVNEERRVPRSSKTAKTCIIWKLKQSLFSISNSIGYNLKRWTSTISRIMNWIYLASSSVNERPLNRKEFT